MISRSAFGRTAQRALRSQCLAQPVGRRGLAAPASGSFQYQTGDAAGVKFASRDMPGPMATVVLVAKAGTRYQPLPGLSEGLEKYAFRGTEKRSALRIVRESELLGAELSSYYTRENLVLGARFLRDDLPYFVELLAEVAGKTSYAPHLFQEEVMPLIELNKKKFLGSAKEMATSSAHGLAFHRGLGSPLNLQSYKYLSAENIEWFASGAYAKSNFAVVANGADQAELSKWVGEFFTDVPNQPASDLKLESSQTKYYGGEERVSHPSGNAMVLAFPGSSSFTGGFYKPEIAVLASLLGGETSIKWSPGFSLLSKAVESHPGVSVSTKSAIYSDAGLLTVTMTGSASAVGGAAADVVSTIKKVAAGEISAEDITKAKAHAKFKELEFGQNVAAGLELTGSGLVQGGKAYQLDETAKAIDSVTEDSVKKAAKTLLESKASVSAVGDLFQLPYAQDLGLSV